MIRFLSDAAREGGELLLYSDEPMNWMTGDRAYFALWASLMAKCVSRGVTIKIIHNVDRIGEEMIDAIRGWFLLYVSGRIEPFVFSNPTLSQSVSDYISTLTENNAADRRTTIAALEKLTR